MTTDTDQALVRVADILGEPVTLRVELGRVGGTKPWPSESAGRQSGNRVWYPAELADQLELAAVVHGPAVQFLRVDVDRV